MSGFWGCRAMTIGRVGAAFFLQAVEKQADENTRKAKAILDLYEERKHWIIERNSITIRCPVLGLHFPTACLPGAGIRKKSKSASLHRSSHIEWNP